MLTDKQIKRKAHDYAISISPYSQDRGPTWDDDTEKGYIQGYNDGVKDGKEDVFEKFEKQLREVSWYCYISRNHTGDAYEGQRYDFDQLFDKFKKEIIKDEQ